MNTQAATLKTLKNFIGEAQLRTMFQLSVNGEEREFFTDKMIELESTIQTMPKTYETDGQGRAGGKGEEITTIDSRLGHGMDDGLMKGTAFLYDIFLAAIKVKNTVCFSLGVSSPYRFLP
jgi:hypothetical protein